MVSFDEKAAEVYAEARNELEKAGTPLGLNDAVIAATVMAFNGILITHNIKEFTQIPELRDKTRFLVTLYSTTYKYYLLNQEQLLLQSILFVEPYKQCVNYLPYTCISQLVYHEASLFCTFIRINT